MNRRHLVRLQIAALAVLTGLVLARTWQGGGRPEGVVVIDRVEAYALREAAFEVADRAATIRIQATGSFERGIGSDTTLAAYGWILRHDTREPVWVMRREATHRGSSMLVHADTTLTLDPGLYEAYFASYGSYLSAPGSRSFFRRLFDERQHWANDARHWEMAIHQEASEEGGRVESVSMDELRDRWVNDAVWMTGPVETRGRLKQLLEVSRPVSVEVRAIGEIDNRRSDYGWIRRPVDEDTVWTMTSRNTVWAGGAAVNRMFSGRVELQAGIHEAGYVSDAGHGFGRWRANPPFDPRGWGLTLSVSSPDDTAAVREFDPWQTRRPIVSLAPVGNDEHRSVSIELPEAAQVIAYAVGEIGRSRYDYGWLEHEAQEQRVWEMTAEASSPAGGHGNNRREVAFLALDPGSYTLHFRTDGSHAYGDFRNGEPSDPERWGVTLFPVEDDGLEGFTVGEVQMAPRPGDGDAPVAPEPEAIVPSGPVIADLTRLGNERRERQVFSLEQPTEIYIRALGEITVSNRYDYGWIENVDSGERVWEMTFGNTTHAGGDSRNRIFEGVIGLPPGTYAVHFETDFSHAHGDFRTPADQPRTPDAWGIFVGRQE